MLESDEKDPIRMIPATKAIAAAIAMVISLSLKSDRF
jgi:hypothetical protein